MKKRHVFALDNFMGLDTESKPLKVDSFRASNGTNFILESKTLKTRPAFKFEKDPIHLVEGEYIIDWYVFQGVYIYITNKHFRFKDGEEIYHEFSSNILNPEFIHKRQHGIDFEGLNPFFHEEKSCLFIYGLDAVYVFSVFKDFDGNIEKYIFYDLNDKPSNPFAEAYKYYQNFEDLPEAYIPTIFIDDDRFEDVNLLSNSVKYELFASSQKTSSNTFVSHKLPTHYDEEKHLGYSVNIDVYHDKFEDLNALPAFIGRENEDVVNLSVYGTEVNASDHIKIKDTFYPTHTWKYNRDPETPETVTTVSEILEMDKNWFFKSRAEIAGEEKLVFQFLIDHIKSHPEYIENKIMAFDVDVKANVVYRNPNNDFITENVKENKTVTVYAQIRKYITDEVSRENETVNYEIKEDIASDEVWSDSLPSDSFNHSYDVPNIPIEVNSIHYSLIDNYISGILETYQEDIADGERVRIIGEFYETRTREQEREIEKEDFFNWITNDEADLSWEEDYQDYTAYSTYPSMPLDWNGLPTIEPNELIYKDRENWNEWTTEDMNELQGLIEAECDSVFMDTNGPNGHAVAKIRTHTYYADEPGIIYAKARNVLIKFYFQEETMIEYENRITVHKYMDIKKSQVSVWDKLYNIEYNDKEKSFDFKLKDYFFDYQSEPVIDITVTFDENPDVDKIAKSRFGTTFGSEERIFLAGHQEYPNIDRYNVSNDLLGNGNISQSYESTYFPSKNYRVLGGNGKINGYVIATDTLLYVTKEKHRNDERFFIRQRNVNDEGKVLYRGYKTNIKQTPLNSRCLVRFNNDILILSENGLYAIEISDNILVNERLLKLRSSYVNNGLVDAIENLENKEHVFMVENNYYLYVFVENVVYVADSRYLAENPESQIKNISYEMVRWDLPLGFHVGHFYENKFVFLDENGYYLYNLKEHGFDDDYSYHASSVSLIDISEDTTCKNAFLLDSEMEFVETDPLNKSFIFEKEGYKYIAEYGSDFNLSGTTVNVLQDLVFSSVNDDDVLYYKDLSGVFHSFVVSGFEEPDRNSFESSEEIQGGSPIYRKITDTPLYVSLVFDYDINGSMTKLVRLSSNRPSSVEILEKDDMITYADYLIELEQRFERHNDYEFTTQDMLSFYLNQETPIELYWVSGITDFGNNLMEKTMFRSNVYATRQENANEILFGYKTMRRLKSFENGTITADLSNATDFSEIDFNSFSLNTFNEIGMSFPTKENNFLYIQFMFKATGNIELNAFEVIYKNNRMLKTIG